MFARDFGDSQPKVMCVPYLPKKRNMYLTLRTSILSFSLLALTVLYSSCKKEGTPPPEPGEPWKVQINMGNFNINSVPVVTNEDIVEIDRLHDYVMYNDLPKVDFEHIGIQVWIPTEKGLSTAISDLSVRVGVVATIKTGNIYDGDSSRFRERVNHNGITYDVYEIFGYYDDELGKIGPLDFHHVIFEMKIEYEKDERVIGSRAVELAVYRGD